MEKIPFQSLEFYSARYRFQILCLTAGIRIVYLFFIIQKGTALQGFPFLAGEIMSVHGAGPGH